MTHGTATINVNGFDLRVYDVTGSKRFKGHRLIVSTNIDHQPMLDEYCDKDEKYCYLICANEDDIDKSLCKIYEEMD